VKNLARLAEAARSSLMEASSTGPDWDEVYKQYVFTHFVQPLKKILAPLIVDDEEGESGTSAFFSVGRNKTDAWDSKLRGYISVDGQPNGGWTLTVHVGQDGDNEGLYEKSTTSDKVGDLVNGTALAVKKALKL